MQCNGNQSLYRQELDSILASDLADMPKLAKAFEGLTGFIIAAAMRQIELAQAMGDRQEMVKQQIKMETFKHARAIFQTCYTGVTGKAAWDEPARR